MKKAAESSSAISPRWVIEGEGIRLELGRRTLVMGVLNITPDSFSDGGSFLSPDKALARAEAMAAEGADLIDIGGESSRPGSDSVSLEEELRRVIPVIERIASKISLPVSIDTTKGEVARRALSAGARMINDISALRADPRMAHVASEGEVPVVLMHMKGSPKTMQEDPRYDSVMDAIDRFFEERLRSAVEAGIRKDRIILDPGIGFGKTTEHNLEIIRSLRRLERHGRPLLIGPSRKSFIGKILDLPVEERLEGTAAAVTAGVLEGASIVRVHDVKAMIRVVRLADSIRSGQPVLG
jgi:dihydropteroate synthase